MYGVHPGKGTLVCCGKPIELQVENTVDASKEKHVPVLEKVDGGFKVTVGGTPRPMEDKHYIEWIELQAYDRLLRRYLKPGMPPEAVFMRDADRVTARAYCNLHGHWKSE